MKMGVMDKFLHAMNFYEADEYEDEDYYEEGEIVDNTVRKPVLVRENDYEEENEPKIKKQVQKVQKWKNNFLLKLKNMA